MLTLAFVEEVCYIGGVVWITAADARVHSRISTVATRLLNFSIMVTGYRAGRVLACEVWLELKLEK